MSSVRRPNSALQMEGLVSSPTWGCTQGTAGSFPLPPVPPRSKRETSQIPSLGKPLSLPSSADPQPLHHLVRLEIVVQ